MQPRLLRTSNLLYQGVRCYISPIHHDTVPIVLMTDASDYGVGGYLYQLIDDKKELVALVSTSVSATQLRWSVIQKEAYAIFYCCTYLDAMLRDRHISWTLYQITAMWLHRFSTLSNTLLKSKKSSFEMMMRLMHLKTLNP